MPSILSAIGLLLAAQAGFIPFEVHLSSPTPTTTSANLEVPFTPEVPDGQWVAPWNNACEEAAVTMVDAWYKGEEELTKVKAKALMRQLFAWQDARYGGNADSNAERTQEIIAANTSFSATIVRNPTIEDIKEELAAGRPVIGFHYGYTLNNPQHRWRQGGSYFHVMVLVGFDDEKEEFIVNDSALEKGLDYRYSYATIMDSLHDFDHTRRKADGPPTVLFTAKK